MQNAAAETSSIPESCATPSTMSGWFPVTATVGQPRHLPAGARAASWWPELSNLGRGASGDAEGRGRVEGTTEKTQIWTHRCMFSKRLKDPVLLLPLCWEASCCQPNL